jgi:hypothetical protein
LKLFSSDEAFQKIWGFLKHLKRNGGFFQKCEAFWTILRLSQDMLRKVEAFDYKCEAFIKIMRLFEDIFTEMEALIRNLRLLKLFSMELRLFPRIRGFFKFIADKWRFLSLMWEILKDYEAFWRHFQRNGGSCLGMWGFYKD